MKISCMCTFNVHYSRELKFNDFFWGLKGRFLVLSIIIWLHTVNLVFHQCHQPSVLAFC
jgi:hypothetical protein